MNGAPIVDGDGQKGTIFFTDMVLQNSFWADNGAQPNDVIKSIDGTLLTLQNANEVLEKVFMWKPGKDVDVKLDRNGEEIVIKTKTTPSYTMGEGIMEKSDAVPQQIAVRNAWLKG
jgi:C-terminal processing protease CtpA/Prc